MSEYADALQDLLKKKMCPEGQRWKSIPEIVKEEKLSKPTVRGVLNQLVEDGTFEMTTEYYSKNEAGNFVKTKYYRKKK